MAQKLDPAAVRERLKVVPGWVLSENGNAITKSFRFKDFGEAWAFMSRVALLAEQMNHHPEWLNVWNRVDVTLNTHDAGGLTDLDFKMAAAMDRFAGA